MEYPTSYLYSRYTHEPLDGLVYRDSENTSDKRDIVWYRDQEKV